MNKLLFRSHPWDISDRGMAVAHVITIIIFGALWAYTYYRVDELTKAGITGNPMIKAYISHALARVVFLIWIIYSLVHIGERRQAKQMKDVVERLNWTIEQISKAKDSKGPKTQTPWPWGNHHTEALGHLEAAATRWWVRYDPTDPTTAPTNEMVASWLRDERGVTRERANAIASILRADGIRPGPRA